MIRVGLFATLAAVLNLLMFLFMSMMVRNSQIRQENVETASLVDFVQAHQTDTPSPTQRPRPPKPPEPVRIKPLPKLDILRLPSPTPLRLQPPRVDLDLALQMNADPYIGNPLSPETPTSPMVVSARELTPLVTLPPRYPPTAKVRRVEGFVEVEFTVEKDGTTSDIRVIEAQPAGVFERATETAIRRWRFQPNEIDNQAFAVRARQRVVFRLDAR